MQLLRRLSLLVTAILSVSTGYAQDVPLVVDVPVHGVEAYRAEIPRPETILGHEIGARHTEPAQVVAYFQAVAAVSDRVTVGQHGASYEGRPLIHAIVTSPANHARLESIREANLRLSDAPESVSENDLAGMPAVVFMGYSIHGNEASGTEAALLLLYHLAAGEGSQVQGVLDNLVVIIDPMLNPDGRDRFVDWVNRNRGAVPTADPQDREHNEPWPGGRTNHYWFDLNRDWLLLQHPESRGRVALFHHWRPQVLTDFHEMGSEATYFFQPGVPSRTNPNTPPRNQELTAEIAAYHAAALDEIGQLYYTEESFDDFYYGKGSTYPDINGAVGILFEQASSRALERETSFGKLSYATTIRNQFATSLSTLRAAVDMRRDLLAHQRDFYRAAEDVARSYPIKGYVISLEDGRSRAQALAHILQQHRVDVYALARDVDEEGLTFRAGRAYLVPMDQPQAALIKAVMERVTSFQDSLFYDVSTWTLPLAFDVTYAELRRDVSALKGPVLDPVEMDGGELVGGRSRYAYLFEWERYYAPRALYRLQQAGVRPMVMTEPFRAVVDGQERSFNRGTIVVSVAQRDAVADTVHNLVQTIVERDHLHVYAVDSGLTPGGPDLGSRGAVVLDKPVVALLTGTGTSAYNAGETWHLLNERFGIPVSLIDVDDAEDVDLERYNTIVMAGGPYSNLPHRKVRDWVQSGGTLIAMNSAVDWVVAQEMVALESRSLNLDSLFQDVPYADLTNAYGAQGIGGAIFEVRLDTTHPVAYGLSGTMPVFRDRSNLYAPLEAPGVNVAVYTDEPLLSGYISEQRLEQLKGSAAVVANRMGRGRIVLIMDNPNFRAFWYGTNRLFLNAVFLSDVM